MKRGNKANETGRRKKGSLSQGSRGPSPVQGKEKKQENESPMRCRVTSTMNNTKVVRTWYDSDKGKRVNRVKTAGSLGYKNAKRGTVYAAQEVIADVAKTYLESYRSRGKEPKGRHVLRRGMGRGRAVVLNELSKFTPRGLKILTVSDATKDAHNGCRRKKKRRV
jgi:ribosomal protein S11